MSGKGDNETGIKVKCPKCGKEFRTVPVTSIVPDDGNLRKLLDGSLNKVKCGACGAEFVLETPLTYRDKATSFIVFCLQPPEDGNTEPIENDVDSMATDAAMKEGIARPIVRLTFSRPDFIEKIMLHNAGYDDRLVEFAKLQLFRSLDELQLSRSRHRLLFDFSKTDEQSLMFIVYDNDELKPVNAVQVPMEDYRGLEEELEKNADLQKELDAAFPGCYVSADRLL
ncbi:MAG: hypothetical protein IJS15_03910 [Victivallales bacterium]|nr:hypothetical protein [Victivallales bacterium]